MTKDDVVELEKRINAFIDSRRSAENQILAGTSRYAGVRVGDASRACEALGGSLVTWAKSREE